MGWDWGIILTVVGVGLTAVAVPTVFQMIGGAPKLKFSFENFDNGRNKLLICSIENVPVSNRLLKLLKVYRQSVQVTAAFQIRGAETGQLVTSVVHGAFPEGAGESLFRNALLPPHPIGFSVLIHAQHASIPDERKKTNYPLGPGNYIAEIIVTAADNSFPMKREFVIGVDRHKTNWIN